eukprot:6027858-Alexandrium_andersonii.AAC.1
MSKHRQRIVEFARSQLRGLGIDHPPYSTLRRWIPRIAWGLWQSATPAERQECFDEVVAREALARA